MEEIYVKLNYTQNNKNKKVYRGYFNISTLTFVSGKTKFVMEKDYEKCIYNERIVFINKKTPQEWIFQCVPTEKIIKKLKLTKMEIEKEKVKVKSNNDTDSGSEYNPDSESDTESDTESDIDYDCCEEEEYEDDY